MFEHTVTLPSKVDAFDTDEVTAEEIVECNDPGTLLGWYEDCEAVLADVKGQLEVGLLDPNVDMAWVYRTGKAAGYYRRAQARIKSRLNRLGVNLPAYDNIVAALRNANVTLKSELALAAAFKLLASRGAITSFEYRRLEDEAMKMVSTRKNKESNDE